jgi:hypothetical protein
VPLFKAVGFPIQPGATAGCSIYLALSRLVSLTSVFAGSLAFNLNEMAQLVGVPAPGLFSNAALRWFR